jgi:hypothetical protein
LLANVRDTRKKYLLTIVKGHHEIPVGQCKGKPEYVLANVRDNRKYLLANVKGHHPIPLANVK